VTIKNKNEKHQLRQVPLFASHYTLGHNKKEQLISFLAKAMMKARRSKTRYFGIIEIGGEGWSMFSISINSFPPKATMKARRSKTVPF